MNIHLGAYSDELFALVVHYGGKIHQLPTMITSRHLLKFNKSWFTQTPQKN